MKTHLVFAGLTAILLWVVIGNSKEQLFNYEDALDEAKRVFKQPYYPPVSKVPKFLSDLNYDQYRDIRWKEDKTLWRMKGLPFQIRFFHMGHTFKYPVEIFEVNKNRTERVRYSPEFFDYGKNHFKEKIPDDLGYAGFRIHYPLNRDDYLDELAVFLGGSYFRSLGKGLIYGLSARGLAVNTAVPKISEEFPAFTKFWLIEPTLNSREFVLYALMESKSVCGAYEFRFEPNAATRIRVKVTLFLKNLITRLGIAPLTSMYWFGENTSNTFGDFRPEVHDSDGLLIQTASGQWVWRPLAYGKQIQYNAFSDINPKGFGLLQRDRDFSHYQDLEARYHMRPSAWIEPIGSWGTGSVQLIQLPTSNEFMDNVNAFWVPSQLPKPGEPLQFEYMIHWYNENQAWPPLARCLSTRVDNQESMEFRNIILEFSGAKLDTLPVNTPPEARVAAPQNGKITDVQVMKNEFNGAWRVSFIVQREKAVKPVEMTCTLYQGNEPLSEKWSYTWIP